MKKALVFLLALLLALSAFGCAPADAAPAADSPAPVAASPALEPTLSGTLTVWSWDVALAQLRDTAARFNEVYPDVKFVFEEMGTDQIYDKMTTSLATGSGLPDIVSLEGGVFSKYGTKFPGAFLDFTDDIQTADFLPSKLAEATVNGRILAYPWDAAPCGLFYRQDVFEAAGVDPASLKTWDDLIAAGQTIREKTGYGVLPLATSRNDNIYRILLMQLNSWYFAGDGSTQVDSEASVKAMTMVKKLYEAGVTVNHADWDEYVSIITQDKVACVAEAVWMAGSMKEEGAAQTGNWRVMDLPMLDETSTGAASNGGSLIAVPAATKNGAAAKAFVTFAMTDVQAQVDGFVNYGLYPSYIPSYSESVFTEGDDYFGGQKIYELFAQIGKRIPQVDYTPNYEEMGDMTKNAVAQVTLEGADVKETMAALQAELVNKFGK